MFVPPRSSHRSPALLMLVHCVAVICKFLEADGALSVLIDDLPVQQSPHLGWRLEFAIPFWMVRIFDALDTKA